MKKNELLNKVTKTLHKGCFTIKKHSPEILVVAGVVGVVGSAVLACKATTKLGDILDETKDTIETIHRSAEQKTFHKTGEDGEVETIEYTEEDGKKDMAVVYVQTGVKLMQLYGPAIALGTLSITGILTSHNILKRRNVALAAAYATIDKGFKEYRNRVVERFGEAVDRELKYNIKAKKIEMTETDPETGKEKTVKKTVDVGDPNAVSDYGYIFDSRCPSWGNNYDYNRMFLRAEQNYANDLLRSRGHIFLNEVYDRLGIPRTKAGQIVGWVYNQDEPVGDNYVDFGVQDIWMDTDDGGHALIFALDFNVDGNVLDLM